MQVYQIDCDRFRKRNSGRKLDATMATVMEPYSVNMVPAEKEAEPQSASPQRPKPAIQSDIKSTVGAHNKNQVLKRIRGVAFEMTMAEVCNYMQQITQIQHDQKQRFIKAHGSRIPAIDKELTDPDALCLSICFHELYSYKKGNKPVST